MTFARVLIAAVVLAAATSAQAQVAPPRAGSVADQHRYQADRHRYEMDRLRAQADQRAAFAHQQQLETRLNRLEIEAARQPEPDQPPPYRPLRSPEEERALRRSAAERRQAMTSGVTQIDDWLNRSPR